MLHKNPIDVENELAHKMLGEAVNNIEIKDVLRDISSVLITHVLMPLRLKLKEVKQFSELPKEYQELLGN
jgi:hypothetical protein